MYEHIGHRWMFFTMMRAYQYCNWRAYILHELKSQGFLRSIELIIIGISRKYNGVFCKNLGTNRAFAFQEFMRNPDVA